MLCQPAYDTETETRGFNFTGRQEAAGAPKGTCANDTEHGERGWVRQLCGHWL
jgi:hypothetical protein